MGMIFLGRRLSADELVAVGADPTLTGDLLRGSGSDVGQVDLDKAWGGLHFLLTGSAWEPSPGGGEAIMGGEPIGGDVGYGPARLVPPDRVRVVADVLRPLDIDGLRARFDPVAMDAEGVYPQIWEEGLEAFETYLWPYFVELRNLYLAAAERGEAVLVAVT